jgi:hypothetical protein
LIEKDLPNLSILKVEQNTFWHPDQEILSLPRLLVIDFLFTKVFLTNYLLICYLVRKNTASQNESYVYEPYIKRLFAKTEKPVEPNQLLTALSMKLQTGGHSTLQKYQAVGLSKV